jgi:hypothetical protein
VIASTRAKVSASPIRLGHVTAIDAAALPAFVRSRRATLEVPSLDDVLAAILRDAA